VCFVCYFWEERRGEVSLGELDHSVLDGPARYIVGESRVGGLPRSDWLKRTDPVRPTAREREDPSHFLSGS
jgi:hypothetical protein